MKQGLETPAQYYNIILKKKYTYTGTEQHMEEVVCLLVFSSENNFVFLADISRKVVMIRHC